MISKENKNISIIKGNIFTTKCQTIVNTVNCVGVMGAGIAYEFRLRYPEMFRKYVEICNKKQLNIGRLWIYNTDGVNHRKILNFPTKYNWKFPSKIEYLEEGLKKFLLTYKEKNITSIAFPMLGADRGGLSEMDSLGVMVKYLSQCDIEVEIYQYDPSALDDLFLKFKEDFNSLSEADFSKQSGIRIDYVKKIHLALGDESIRTLSQLLTVRGIGDKTLEKAFRFVMEQKKQEFLVFNKE